MTDSQLTKYLRGVERINKRDIRMLARLKIKVDDKMDCTYLVTL